MELSEALRKRRSIRKYKPGNTVSDEDIHKILEAAMMAPSACNTRPWEFYVFKSEEARQRVMDIHANAHHLKDASVAILVSALPEAQPDKAEGYYPQDCGAAIENMLLQALDLGYGTCWCGIHPRENRVEAYRKEFGITSLPLGLVIIGTPDEEPKARGFYEEAKVTVL